jgi:hypothetical protein
MRISNSGRRRTAHSEGAGGGASRGGGLTPALTRLHHSVGWGGRGGALPPFRAKGGVLGQGLLPPKGLMQPKGRGRATGVTGRRRDGGGGGPRGPRRLAKWVRLKGGSASESSFRSPLPCSAWGGASGRPFSLLCARDASGE